MATKNKLHISSSVCTELLARFSEYEGNISLDDIADELSFFNQKAVAKYLSGMQCKCYVETKESQFDGYDSISGRTIYSMATVGRCWGTPERDICFCGGNKNKCEVE